MTKAGLYPHEHQIVGAQLERELKVANQGMSSTATRCGRNSLTVTAPITG